ncbi:MAG: primosomal protein N', partial [Defluviitaleaceae bacterium]|nr:primosomal protein N' [Defluviitaleaceae bacterium]
MSEFAFSRVDSESAAAKPTFPIEFALVCVEISHSDVDKLFHYKIPAGQSISAGLRVRVPFGKSIKIGYVMEISNEPPDIAPEKVKEIHSACDDFCVLTKETIALAFWLREKYYTTLAACVRAIVPSAKADGKFPGTRKKICAPEKKISREEFLLTSEQSLAVSQIEEIILRGGLSPANEKNFANAPRPPILLHGVTGSGKTEVYLRAIEKILQLGREAIVLVPEIALTPQMVALFSERFGAAVAVTHSRLTPGERFHIWKQALDGEIRLVIGPRSAIFAPFQNLGLIVVDEEHEHTYHSETSPKYDAREVAIKRAEICGATVILGSATPSLDSYLKATACEKKFFDDKEVIQNEQFFTLSKLTKRVNKTLPEIHVIDMRKEIKRGNTSVFSAPFENALRETLAADRQAILFLNRRGYSSFVSCRWCGNVLTCENCRVNYTYHVTGNFQNNLHETQNTSSFQNNLHESRNYEGFQKTLHDSQNSLKENLLHESQNVSNFQNNLHDSQNAKDFQNNLHETQNMKDFQNNFHETKCTEKKFLHESQHAKNFQNNFHETKCTEKNFLHESKNSATKFSLHESQNTMKNFPHDSRRAEKLLCHYCGKSAQLPKKCPACESEHIRRYGTGTQKVEEEIAALFPETKILRMDMDTTRGKFGHAKILNAFKNGEAQILIGTQMVAKGLDFPRVTMVGVVAADMSLHTGDFCAGEYTFQLLTQVSGRAGRAE